ncbi:ATP-binding protein [Paraburkholderia aspalathi]|uniref:AAA domain-containing protein n=1 Tax=Paraburkholderia aspalathi TaxID=1324617 RepID=A0A1I7C879_9BURK|nr:ATP-binding protein [Paraburkholderia aspalathi]SFT95626.1 AAA domain-containing protein [Paraburkholderia aspalathi]
MITREQAIAGSPEDKEAYMKATYVPHRNLENVMSEVRSRMTAGAGLSITMVVGPPGVGKSTFGRVQLRNLLSRYPIQLQEKPHVIPAVMSEVDAADKGEFNFILLYNRLCADLLAPSALDGFVLGESVGEPADPIRNSRLMFERALKRRAVKHLILDEAVHFTNSQTDPLQYGNLLKSLSNRSGFNLLLLGAYGCEQLVLASAQLARRIGIVHYPRYHQTEEDFIEYCTFVKSLLAHMPYNLEIDIERHLEYLFAGTFGLPGTTVDVLMGAAARCFENKSKMWKDAFLLQCMPSKAAQRKIARDTVRGEKDVQPFLQMELFHDYATEQDIVDEMLLAETQHKKLNGGRANG